MASCLFSAESKAEEHHLEKQVCCGTHWSNCSRPGEAEWGGGGQRHDISAFPLKSRRPTIFLPLQPPLSSLLLRLEEDLAAETERSVAAEEPLVVDVWGGGGPAQISRPVFPGVTSAAAAAGGMKTNRPAPADSNLSPQMQVSISHQRSALPRKRTPSSTLAEAEAHFTSSHTIF